MNALTQDYVEGLRNDLKNPQEAAAYLNAALEEEAEDVFLLALCDVMAAKETPSFLFAPETPHETRAEMLTDPHLSNLLRLLENLGLRLAVAVKSPLTA